MSPGEFADVIAVLGVLLGSNVIVTIINIRAKRKDSCVENNKRTTMALKMTIYIVMSMKIEMLLNQGYATPEQRNEMNELHKLYKLWGWNGDMDSRIAKIYQLPTKPIHNRRSADTK